MLQITDTFRDTVSAWRW